MTIIRATLNITAATICDSADHEALQRCDCYSEALNSSPGALSVLADMRPDFDTFWADGCHDDETHREFLVRLLGDLSEDDEFLDDIRSLTCEDSPIKHEEFWGGTIRIEFQRVGANIVATFPSENIYLQVICD